MPVFESDSDITLCVEATGNFSLARMVAMLACLVKSSNAIRSRKNREVKRGLSSIYHGTGGYRLQLAEEDFFGEYSLVV